MMTEDGFQFLRPHKVVEKTVNGQKITGLELLENDYEGIIVSYGKVEFDESNPERVTMRFDYEILRDNEHAYDKKELEQYLGDLLQELIIYGIHKNNLVYTGGTDDDREDNSQQPDSQ